MKSGPNLRARRLFLLIIMTLALAALSDAKAPKKTSEKSLKQRLIGTWRLISFEDRTSLDSPWKYPYGEHPVGLVTYDAAGYVTVQVMKIPAQSKFAAGADDKGTDEEIKSAYQGYVAYFGTYTVNEAENKVVHHVKASLQPGYTATDQERPIQVDGDRLIYGDQKLWQRIFQREK